MKVILLLIIAFAAGVIAYGVSMVRHGFSARATPSWEEIYVARKLRDTAIPAADKALAAGFTRHMSKPVNLSALRQAVAELLV